MGAFLPRLSLGFDGDCQPGLTRALEFFRFLAPLRFAKICGQINRRSSSERSPSRSLTTMNFDATNPGFGDLRVTPQEHEIRELAQQFPMLARTEISDVILRFGPMRTAVEAELLRLSGGKR